MAYTLKYGVALAAPVVPGSPKERAAKDKTAQIAQKLLLPHMHTNKSLLVKDLHVTHSWAKKPASLYADPRFAYTVLIPAKGWALTVKDVIAAFKDVKSLYKEIGEPRVHGTAKGMLVSIGFHSGLAKAELMEDLFG
jgi:hypothetical protein